MAVVGSAELRSGFPKGEFSLTGRKYTVQWLVNVDSLNDGPATAQSAPGLPAAFEYYSIGNDIDILARLRQWSANRLEDRSFQWVVEAIYSTPEPKEGGGGVGERGAGAGTHTDTANDYQLPLLELPVVKTFSVEREVPITRVYNLDTGLFNPPMASNCEVFNPPAMKKERMLALSISRNEVLTAPHPAIGVAYSGAVNSDVFWGLPAGIVQCQSITAERQTKQIQGGATCAYLRCEYVFHCKPDTWDLYLLDAGNYWCSGPPGGGSGSGCCPTQNAFLDKQGHPIRGLLDGDGFPLPAGDDPVYQRLRPYNWLPFSALNLPQSFLGVQ